MLNNNPNNPNDSEFIKNLESTVDKNSECIFNDGFYYFFIIFFIGFAITCYSIGY
jgi:hypothetical protein